MEPCSEKPHRPRPRLENSTSPCESEQSTLSTSVGSFSPCCAAGSTTTVSVTPVVDDSPSADGSSSRVTTSRAALSPVDKADFRGSQGRVERGADDTRKQTRLKSDLKRRPRLSAQFLLPSGIEGYSKNVSYSKHGSATPAHAGRLSDAVDSLARELERLQERRRLTASTLLPSILAELNLSPRADMQGLKLLSASGTLGVVNPRIRSSPAKASSRHLDFAGKLDMLTKQLLVFSYSFVAFHTLTLHFCPSVYSALRFGPELNTDPLLHQPHPDSLFGFFFFFMNTSIQVFVKRGVSAALIHAGLLHLARLAIVRGKGPQKPSSKNTGKLLKNDQGLSTTPLAHRRYHENINQQTKGSKERIDYVTRSVPYSPTSPPVTTTLVLPSSYTPTFFSAPSLSSIASPLRSQLPHRHGQYGWSEESCLSSVPSRSPAQVRRRMRFVSRILAVACCLSLFITVTAFLWGGWPAKAVGFPDIYLGALTKKGSFTGPENLRSVLRSTTAEATLKRIKAFRQESMVSPSMNSRSLLEKWSLDASKGLLYYRMVVFFVLGFLLDAWGAWTKVRLIRQFLKLRDLIIPGLIFTVAMSYAAIHLQGFPSCNAKDRHWVDFRAEELAGNVNTSTHDKINTPPLLYSVYIPMRDGVELAADVYLPKPYYETAEQLAAGHHRIELLEAALRKTKKRLETLQFQESHSGDKGEAPLFSDRIVGREPKKTIFKRYQEIRNLIHFQTHVEKRIKDEQEEYNTVLASVKKLPTYLDITRYNRRTQVYWPLSMLRMWKNPRGATVNLWSFPAQQAFTANGYAVVVVDSRGTGASFGERYVDLSEVEIQDFSEIVAWVKAQWFSNGKVGGGGISYDGMTGLSTAAAGGVDAVLSLFTPMHVFGDLLVPGGFVCSSFLKDYAGMTYGFERAGTPLAHMLNNPWKYPLHVLLGFSVAFGPGSGVFGREGDLARAIMGHKKNWDMGHTVQMVEYYDDVVTLHNNETASAAEFGIHEAVMRKLAERNVSVYAVGGYCDSASVRGASRLYEYMKRNAPESRSKLLLGSWSHGGRRSCSPYAGSFPCFEADQYLDAVRFFDCHLKGQCWGNINDEPSVHYWQVGSEEWRTSEYYPPARHMRYVDFHLSNEKFVNLNNLECKRTTPEPSVLVLGQPVNVCVSPHLSSLSIGGDGALKCPLPTSPFTVRVPERRDVGSKNRPKRNTHKDCKKRKEHSSVPSGNANPPRGPRTSSSSASSSPTLSASSAPSPSSSSHRFPDDTRAAMGGASSPFSLPVLLPVTFDLRLSTFEHRLHDIVQSITLYGHQLQTHVELLLRQAREHPFPPDNEQTSEEHQPLTISNIIRVALAAVEDGWGETDGTTPQGSALRSPAAPGQPSGLQKRSSLDKKPIVGRLKDSFAILEADPDAYSMRLDAQRTVEATRSPEAYVRPSLAREIPMSVDDEPHTLSMRKPRLTLAKRLLLKKFPSKLSPRLHYDVEYFSTTGVFSRWVIAQHPFRQAVHYGNRLFARRTRPDFPINLSPLPGAEGESFHPSPFYLDSVHARLLSWTSGVLVEEVDVVGSAWIHLQMFVKSCTDIAVFVYLEAVDVNGGYSHYVTEGKIVVSHRPVTVKEESPIGSPDTVFRPFTKSSRIPLNSSGELIEFTMPLEPVSWTFKKGQAIRLSLGGSDVDNFQPAVQNRMILPRQWTVVTANAKLRLPVHQHAEAN